MSAFNVVRFRVKPGMEEKFIEAQKKLGKDFTGFTAGHLIKTGDRGFLSRREAKVAGSRTAGAALIYTIKP